jgi:hypothetical protein
MIGQAPTITQTPSFKPLTTVRTTEKTTLAEANLTKSTEHTEKVVECKQTQSHQVESQQEERKDPPQFDLLSHLTKEYFNFEQDQKLACASYEAEIQ